MRISKTGKISDGFYALGIPGAPVYLLDGTTPVLFDAGFSALGQLYERQIREILGTRKPTLLLITHSHFDHIGAANHFKTIWPDIRIAGSAQTDEILVRPSAIKLVRDLSKEGIRLMQILGLSPLCEDPFEPFRLDIILKPNETILLDQSCQITAIHTPGHTWDFMSYWISGKRILVASDAVGVDDGSGYIITDFLVDYDAYCNSLECLGRFDAHILCPGHHLIFTHQDVKEHIIRSLKQARIFRHMVERFLIEEGGDQERTVARVKAIEWDPRPWPKQPESAYVFNTRARVKTLWDCMEKDGKA
jgi:glyoxylase-like metal-dependent hydrolase (beta-lactamase superfamily II)